MSPVTSAKSLACFAAMLLLAAPAARGAPLGDEEALAKTVAIADGIITRIEQEAGGCDALGAHLDAFLQQNGPAIAELQAATARRSKADEDAFLDKFLRRLQPSLQRLATPANRTKLRSCMKEPRVRDAFAKLPKSQ